MGTRHRRSVIDELLRRDDIRRPLDKIRENLIRRGYPMEMMTDSQLLRGVIDASIGANIPGELAKNVKTIRAIVRARLQH